MRRIVLLLAAMAVVMAAALSGLAFGQEVPPGAGCEGIDEALLQQEANPAEEDAKSNIVGVSKTHSCKGK